MIEDARSETLSTCRREGDLSVIANAVKSTYLDRRVLLLHCRKVALDEPLTGQAAQL